MPELSWNLNKIEIFQFSILGDSKNTRVVKQEKNSHVFALKTVVEQKLLTFHSNDTVPLSLISQKCKKHGFRLTLPVLLLSLV